MQFQTVKVWLPRKLWFRWSGNDPYNDHDLKYQYTAKNQMVNHSFTVFR